MWNLGVNQKRKRNFQGSIKNHVEFPRGLGFWFWVSKAAKVVCNTILLNFHPKMVISTGEVSGEVSAPIIPRLSDIRNISS